MVCLMESASVFVSVVYIIFHCIHIFKVRGDDIPGTILPYTHVSLIIDQGVLVQRGRDVDNLQKIYAPCVLKDLGIMSVTKDIFQWHIEFKVDGFAQWIGITATQLANTMSMLINCVKRIPKCMRHLATFKRGGLQGFELNDGV